MKARILIAALMALSATSAGALLGFANFSEVKLTASGIKLIAENQWATFTDLAYHSLYDQAVVFDIPRHNRNTESSSGLAQTGSHDPAQLGRVLAAQDSPGSLSASLAYQEPVAITPAPHLSSGLLGSSSVPTRTVERYIDRLIMFNLQNIIAQGWLGNSSSSSSSGFTDRSRTVYNYNTGIGDEVPDATEGSVLFAGAEGRLAQDNNNFFYDDSNNRLGLGIATPAYVLDVSGGTGIVGQFSGRVIGGAAVNSNEFTTKSQLDALTSGTAGAFIQEGNSFGTLAVLGTNDANSLAIETGGTERLRIDTSGNVGIGTATPAYPLTVGSGDLFGVNSSGAIAAATGITSSGNIDFDSLNTGGLVKAAAATGRLSVATAGTDYESPLTFTNGLTRTANTVALGGTLTGNTTIANAGFNFNITGAGNVGIGTASPSYKLDVAGDINTSIGYKISGITVLQNPGIANIFVGEGAGQTTTVTDYNTFVGYHAGNVTTSCCDAFYGSLAGAVNTTGYLNNFFGVSAGGSNTVGNQNNFFGSNAGFSNISAGANNFFGNHAGYLTTGGSNSFFGHQAGYSTSTGVGNVAFGRSAGISNTTGSNNTFIGYNAGNGSTGTLTNATAIGYNTQVTNSNTLILGNGANVGIGTTTPGANIDIAALAPVARINATGGGIATLSLFAAGATDIQLRNSSGPLEIYSGATRVLNVSASSYTFDQKTFLLGKVADTAPVVLGASMFGTANGDALTINTFNASGGSQLVRFGVTGRADIANTYFLNSNVGIGTSSPTSKVQIVGTGTFGAAGVSALNLSAHTATLTASPATFRAAEVGAMTLAASSAQTVTTASSVYVATPVAGTNVTITNNKPIDTQTGAYLSSGGTWTNTSSRERKENFIALNPQEVLDKIDALSIERWNYKAEDSSVTHIGPVAEEFHAAFDTGGAEGKKSISTIDPAGVALLGIQGLSEKIKALLDFSWVIEEFKKFGVVIEQNIIKIKTLAVDRLQIGSSDKPSGFVLYDKATKKPYCVAIENGQLTTTKGECGNAAPASLLQAPQPAAAPVENPEPTPTEQVAPTEKSAQSPTEEPAASEPQLTPSQTQETAPSEAVPAETPDTIQTQ